MSVMHVVTHPMLFAAVMACTIGVMLHIDIRNVGMTPPFRTYRIRRALLVFLLTWATSVVAVGAYA